MKHPIRKLAISLALVLLLPLSVIFLALSLPDFYAESYYAQLPALYNKLYQTEGKKLVIIGGSNVAFGLDTTLLENTLAEYGYDYTVCPFGLYAAVGTSAMLDLAEGALGEGDIVVLAIEPTSQTMSTYFGATAFWKCCESTPEMILHLSKSKQSTMVGNYIPYLQERFSVLDSDSHPSADSVYAKASFDENGNMVYERSGNVMTLGYDTSTPVDLASVTIAPDFAEQVNEFYALAHSKGAQVFFSFSPVNRSSLTDEDAIQDYLNVCNETFSCPVISDPGNYVWNSGWFYDNNFHLNSAGAILRTYQLAKDILPQLGCYRQIEYELPQMPDSIAHIEESTADERFFIVESLGEGWLISGLTDEGLTQTSLTVPSMLGGKPVIGFTKDALSNATEIQELILPATIESLPDHLFAACSKLDRLVLEHTQKTCSVSESTFSGAERLRIFVPSEAYHLYRDGDGCEVNLWTAYLDRIFTFG